jgi:hypothetical protein
VENPTGTAQSVGQLYEKGGVGMAVKALLVLAEVCSVENQRRAWMPIATAIGRAGSASSRLRVYSSSC